MLFTEPIFLFCFLPAVLALYFLPWRQHRNLLLLVASVIFYASGGGRFVFLILGSIAFNYVMAIWVDRERHRASGRLLLGVTIAANLIVLGVLKYTNFAADNLNVLLHAGGLGTLRVPRVLLPIGISFFSFHAI